MGGKGYGSSFQEGASHTYTLRLGRVEILSCIKKNNNNKKNQVISI